MEPPPAVLAQVNVSRPRADLGSPVMAGFVAALDPLDRLADASPGFVWRMRAEGSHSPLELPDGLPLLVNVSLWRSYEDLHAFVFRTAHAAVVRSRARWFEPLDGATTALWWLPARSPRPTAAEALRRLALLRRQGPTPRACSMRRRFDPDGAPVRLVGR